jgi:rSAM/selenodomain-associated transferase 1
MTNPILVIMAKEPRVGLTKTRLCPPLTLDEAARLYEALLRDSISLANGLVGIDLAIAVTPPESIAYFKNISPPDTLLMPVECIDIGDCLTQVLGNLLDMGYPSALAFNADGPSVPQEYIQTAVNKLDACDVVLGPSEDGGYYLVGLKQLHAEIFVGVSWSTPKVLSQTLTKIKVLGLEAELLPPWFDVDTAADIERIRSENAKLPPDLLVHTRRFLTDFAAPDALRHNTSK